MARLAVAAGLGALLIGNWIGMGAGEMQIAGRSRGNHAGYSLPVMGRKRS
jgi:hypothetical protein